MEELDPLGVILGEIKLSSQVVLTRDRTSLSVREIESLIESSETLIVLDMSVGSAFMCTQSECLEQWSQIKPSFNSK